MLVKDEISDSECNVGERILVFFNSDFNAMCNRIFVILYTIEKGDSKDDCTSGLGV